jgi:hypothetical protein
MSAAFLGTCAGFRSRDKDRLLAERVFAPIIVDQLVDVTLDVMKGKAESTVGDKKYRCCTTKRGQASFLVDAASPTVSDFVSIGSYLTHGGKAQRGCGELKGLGYHSWNNWPRGKCLVYASDLPSELAHHSQADGELVVDLTEVVFKATKEAKLRSGRSYRCCVTHQGNLGKLMDNARPKYNSSALRSFGKFVGYSGCRELAGAPYHSWNKWPGHRCLVQAKDIPSDILKELPAGWRNGPIARAPGASYSTPDTSNRPPPTIGTINKPPATTVTTPTLVPTFVPTQPTASPTFRPTPTPTPPTFRPTPAPTLRPTLGPLSFTVRVVDATKDAVLRDATIELSVDDGTSNFATKKTGADGVVSFTLSREDIDEVDEVVIKASASGFFVMETEYNLKATCPSARCIVKLALSPQIRF